MKISVLAVVFCLSFQVFCQQQTAAPATGTRLRYVILNDTSGRTSWPGGIPQQVDLITQFLEQVVRPGSDVGSLVNFSEEFYLDVENSTDPERVAAKLVRQGHHATALYKAVVLAAEWLAKQEPSDGQKVIFVFSDGDDNASQISLQKVIGTAQGLHIPVSVIAPSVVERKSPGKNMKQLANSTGGHAYFIRGNESLNSAALKRDLAR